MRKVVGYSGNIGSGKTTRADMDVDKTVIHEEVEENFILEQFYAKPKEYVYLLELYVILSRFNKRECMLKRTKGDIVEDRSIFDDMIFVKLLHDDGLLDEWQYNNIKAVFLDVIKKMTPYTEVIWLKASVDTLISRIEKRGRTMEKGITREYLAKLEKAYDEIFIDLIPKETEVTIVVNDQHSL